MKIESSQLQLAATHTAQEHTSVQVTLDKPGKPPGAIANRIVSNASSFSNTSASTVVQLSQQGRNAAQASGPDLSALPDTAATDPVPDEQELTADPRYQLVKSLFEQITGTRFESSSFQLTLDDTLASAQSDPAPTQAAGAPAAPAGPQIHQTRTETHTETEQTNFKAQGSVTTADGRKIDFSVDLTLQRSYSEQTTRHLVNGKPVDPLVINLDGKQVALREGSVSFDLNGDGTSEQVHFVNEGSAFLALDKNGDGSINSGKELFGPQSGNGFQDLAAYDNDQNQVIDENDAVFSQLRLYNKDADGNDQLTTLAEKGVGAIFLNNTATPFALKDQQNQLQGQVRSSGVFLYESGKAGAVQQVDLVV
jgi:hypothetical protein